MVARHLAVALLVLLVGTASQALASTYALTPVLSWTDAEAYANSLGAHLVAVNSQAEQDFLVSTFGGTEYFWIGLTDQDVEGVFVWSNGDPLTYTNWWPGEPNNENNEDYVAMNWGQPGYWVDGHNSAPPLRGIMEFVPEPPAGAALAVAALALAFVAGARRRLSTRPEPLDPRTL